MTRSHEPKASLETGGNKQEKMANFCPRKKAGREVPRPGIV